MGPIGLRWYLTALIVLPFVTCATLTGIFVSQQIDRTRTAADAANALTVLSCLQAVQSDLQAELLTSMSLTIGATPAQRKRTGSDDDAAQPDVSVQKLRASTDTAVSQLAASKGQGPTASFAWATLNTIRADVDSGIDLSQGLTEGFVEADRLSDRLADASAEVLRLDVPAAVGPGISSAIRDATLVRAAARAGGEELDQLVAFKYPASGRKADMVRGRKVFLSSVHSFGTASQRVMSQASPAVVRSWRQALAAQDVAAFDARIQRYVTHPTRPLATGGVLSLLSAGAQRSTSLSQLSGSTSEAAIGVAAGASSTASRSALVIGGVVALALFVSVLIALVVRRKIARPLQALSEQADLVSRGKLSDVTSDGPREVRTVAEGLAAAVGSLRRIEAQAQAVATGDLDSDIVREPLPGPLGQVMHDSVTTIIDAIHERDLAQNDLAHQATHDSLTGLANRHQALVSIEHALHRARRKGDLTGLLFVDLDMFKLVNDNLGHAAGDEVLRVCGQRMTDIVRESDVVYRLGGDEFVVLLEDITRDFPFVDLAERMIAGISEPILLPGGTAQVGASIGISLCQDASLDAERLLGEADAAAYSAKAAGRGRVGVFDEALRAALNHRASTEQALERALEREELVLHYQPVVEMGSGRPIGYEALVRWQHPTRGLVPPADFIPIAEKTTLVNKIGRWTLYEATDQLARWDADRSHPAGLSMAVNISGRHLVANDLVSDVRAALDKSGIDAGRLVIEITETVLVDDPIALHNMQQLRDLGVVVAIDDFGTGYTSIGQLPKLPVDILKIDRSFIGSDLPGHHELVGLIVGAAHAFGLAVVAEGVEVEAQADTLKQLAVDTGQGFFFARPQPPLVAGELASLERLPPTLSQDPTALSSEPRPS